MAPYKIKISYDGTDFHGYQRQFKKRTVQGEIESALKQLGWQGKSILSAGRTDRGVHADGQIGFFSLDWNHSEIALLMALNQHLPEDLSILEIEETKETFHPRFDAKLRKYRYQTYYSRTRNPHLEKKFWRVWPEVNRVALMEASKIFPGRHDFQFYGRPYRKNGRTERIVHSANWRFEGEKGFFEITANSFLYHMVRKIVFVLILTGQKRIHSSILNASLDGNNNLPPGIAPAKGLFLEEIIY